MIIELNTDGSVFEPFVEMVHRKTHPWWAKSVAWKEPGGKGAWAPVQQALAEKEKSQ